MKFAALCLLGTATLIAAHARAATPQDEMFVNQAALGGMAEVQAGQLAQTMATMPTVKAFAAKMVADHVPNNQALATLAASKGLTPPTMLDALHQADLAAVQQHTGALFDAAYINDQVTGHQKMAAVMQGEIQDGTDPDLKAFAVSTLPTVQMHLQMAQQILTGTAP